MRARPLAQMGDNTMGFRLFRRIKIAPGINVNLTKSGASASFGRRGARYTVGGRQGRRTTLGLPGTGLFYTTTSSSRKATARKKSSEADRAGKEVRATNDARETAEPCPADKLTLGFFKRLVTPKGEEAFVDGCRELALGNEVGALKRLRESVHLADGAFLSGLLSLKQERFDDAISYLSGALHSDKELGRLLAKYDMSATMTLAITDEVHAQAGADQRGVLLALVEAYQGRRNWQSAIDCLRRLRRLEPDEVVVKLSLAELLMEVSPTSRRVARHVVRLAEGVENEGAIQAGLLLYKAKALRALGLQRAAQEVLTSAIRKQKDRPAELLHALRYERALVYEETGQLKRVRAEFEKIYSEAPGYKDVAARLGLADP